MIVSAAHIPASLVTDEWPFTLAPVRQVVNEGIAFTRPVTFLVGENGSGKSTIIEGLAEAYGIDVRGGHGGRRYNNAPPKGPLGQALKLTRSPVGIKARGRGSQGFFLRAETALGVFEFMSAHGVAGYGERDLARVSHGEGFLQVFAGRFIGPGLYLMDEPEAALSFTDCLSLVSVIAQLAEQGAQVICATHSPILCAVPGAHILELDENGFHPRVWKDLALTDHWRRFMASPESYLDRLLE
jgi:predicted ATPase